MFLTVTGPECSGKTSLSNYLAKQLDAVLLEEYSREYLSGLNRPYNRADLDAIAEGQVAKLLKVKNSSDRLIISDTFVVVIYVWSKWKYGKVSPRIERLLRDNTPDHYLLCRPDIPWEYDPMRESEGEREELYELYLAGVEKSGVPYTIVEGIGPGRMPSALEAIRPYIENSLT